ncbi:YbaB/EbfC family nucleoid-associated protein [Croceimicrobium hydrocarbonivorans]|uniref:Nucleoid-associated protein H4K34_03115 n=1 Tax=Croceimicrobium hydrocarbonivorans TaxID=2761580 RepID=A0A7H0VGJ8_9FLAO|nr:YbaB/EbfC family nucleoid-associated protein [Croceimicrobium hydrocarbonivorans]QNR24846.1 YbaB/EbfC family nucleoid-associated protein [Croceimicrobium hydrocarbonivorans]
MFGNIKDMMGKLQEAQAQAKDMKDRLEQIEIKESFQGIEIVINGNRKLRDLKIDPALAQDAEELEDKLLLALNKALEKAEALHDAEMKKMASGMMPGLDMFN